MLCIWRIHGAGSKDSKGLWVGWPGLAGFQGRRVLISHNCQNGHCLFMVFIVYVHVEKEKCSVLMLF